MTYRTANLVGGNYIVGGPGPLSGPSVFETVDVATAQGIAQKGARQQQELAAASAALAQRQDARAAQELAFRQQYQNAQLALQRDQFGLQVRQDDRSAAAQARAFAAQQAAAQAAAADQAMRARLLTGDLGSAAAPSAGLAFLAPGAPPVSPMALMPGAMPQPPIGTPPSQQGLAPIASPAAPAGMPSAPILPTQAPTLAPGQAPVAPRGMPPLTGPGGLLTPLPGGPAGSAGLQGSVGVDALGGQAGADTLATQPQTQFGRDVAAVQSAAQTQFSTQRRVEQLQRAVTSGQGGLLGGGAGPQIYGYFADTPQAAAQRERAVAASAWFNDPNNRRMLLEDPQLLAQAEQDPLAFVERMATQQPAPARPSAGLGAAPTPAQTAAPQPVSPTASPVVSAAAALPKPTDPISAVYDRSPELVFDHLDQVEAQMQTASAMAQYHAARGDIPAYQEARAQLMKLDRDQRYLQGMLAVTSIQQQNFGPAQQLLRARYPNQNVELRPYTNGEIDIYMDNKFVERTTWDQFSQRLRASFDRSYMSYEDVAAERKAITDAAREAARSEGKVQRFEAFGDNGAFTSVTEGGREVQYMLQQVPVLDQNGQPVKVGDDTLTRWQRTPIQ